MLRFVGTISVAMLFGLAACSGSSDDGGGGSVDSNESLQAFMGAIALDFVQVLADVAPQSAVPVQKQSGSTSCPEGGTAEWVDSGFGSGTLTLDSCRMGGIAVSGTLLGYLESGPDYVDGTMLRGPITASGRFSAELNVTNLLISAQLPVDVEFTYWEITATTPLAQNLCAWSGGPGCAPSPF
jgi:hypothetical protein